MVGGDGVTKHAQCTGTDDAGRSGLGLHLEVTKERWLCDVGGFWPVVDFAGGNAANVFPQLAGCAFDIGVIAHPAQKSVGDTWCAATAAGNFNGTITNDHSIEQGRAACDDAVSQCLAGGLNVTTPEEQLIIRGVVDAHFPDASSEELRVLGFASWCEGLEKGIAAHHAGLLPAFKVVVEQLFQDGLPLACLTLFAIQV